MEELTKQEKIAILENQQRELAQKIYDATIRRKVAARTEDTAMIERLDNVLVLFEKQRNVLDEIKKEVESN